MPSPPTRARVMFLAHAIATAVFAILNTGGGCGPSGPSLPSTSTACGDAAPGVTFADAGPDSVAAVRLGTTDDDGGFRTIVPGEALTIIHGPQGGEHVWGGAELYSARAATWALQFSIVSDSGAPSSVEAVEACPGGVVVITYVRVVLELPSAFSGVLVLDATELADGGVKLHDEVSIQGK